MTKRVQITIDFLVMDDSELDCFLSDGPADLEGQADIMKDWLREAPYNYSIDFKISEAGLNIIPRTKFHIQKIKDKLFH